MASTLNDIFRNIANSIRDKGITGTMSPIEMPSKIAKIPSGAIPRGVAIDGVKWTDEWQTKGLNGTIVDVVVGDNLAPRLDVCVSVASKAAGTVVTINWGDGSTNTHSTTTVTQFNHTYSSAGHYVVSVSNNASTVYFSGQSATGFASASTTNITFRYNTMLALRKIRQFGSGLTSITSFAAYCRYCNSEEGGYPGELPPLPPTLTTAAYAFSNMMYYRGHSPYLNHITGNVNLTYTFNHCRNMIGSPQILPPKTTNASCVYCGCYMMDCVPYDIFPETMSTTCTTVSNALNSVGTYNVTSGQVAFPKISHLTKVTTMESLFANQKKMNGPLPELPSGSALTTLTSFYNAGYGDNVTVSENWLLNCTGLKTIDSMFANCYNLQGQCPSFPSTITGSINSVFLNCYKLGGRFPTLNEGVTTMNATFQNCYNITGSLPSLPSTVTDIRSAFYGCALATGRFPSLGHLTKLSSGTYCTSAFAYCRNVTLPPLTFLDPSVTQSQNQTSFASMYAYCDRLSEFTFDLSGFLKVTTVDSMFSNCYSLKHGPTKLPPNITNANYLFLQDSELEDNAISLPKYLKLTAVTQTYYQCTNIKPILADNGSIELAKENIYTTRFTSYSNCVGTSSIDLQRQMGDALVASGKSFTAFGSAATGNIPISLCRYYTGGVA